MCLGEGYEVGFLEGWLWLISEEGEAWVCWLGEGVVSWCFDKGGKRSGWCISLRLLR